MKEWSTSSGYRIIRVLSGRSNVFLLTDGKANILVDTSPGFMWESLQKRLARLGAERIDLLILTHTHFDHAANARAISEKFKARVAVHRSEAAFLASGDSIPPAGTNRFSAFLVRSFGGRIDSIARYRGCTHDLAFEDNLDLASYGFRAYVMHTPGHTPGSASVIIDDEIALVGDTMFGVFPRTVFPPFASDVSQMLESWGKLLGTRCRLFLPSHGSANSRSLVESDFKRHTSAKVE